MFMGARILGARILRAGILSGAAVGFALVRKEARQKAGESAL